MTSESISQIPVASKAFKIVSFLKEEIQAGQNKGKKSPLVISIRP
jgi:hypothetical protein